MWNWHYGVDRDISQRRHHVIYFAAVLIATCRCCLASTAAQNYDEAPGEVYVLWNSILNLTWSTSIADNFILYCNWQHYSHGATGWNRFVGYNNDRKERLNHSFSHVGWEFTNQAYPCLGGVYHKAVQPHYAGLYQMNIIDLDNMEYEAQATVKVLKAQDVHYRIQIVDTDISQTLADNSSLEGTLMTVQAGQRINVTVQLLDNFQPSNITVLYDDEQVLFCHLIKQCLGYVPYSGDDDKESVVLIRIDPSIQGADSITLQQRIKINATPESEGSVGLIICLVLLVLIILMCVIFLLVLWRRGLIYRNKNHDELIFQHPNLLCSHKHVTRELPGEDGLAETIPLKHNERIPIAAVKDKIENFHSSLCQESRDVESLLTCARTKLKIQADSFKPLSDRLTTIEIDLPYLPPKFGTLKMNIEKLGPHIEVFKTKLDEKIKKLPLLAPSKKGLTKDHDQCVELLNSARKLISECDKSVEYQKIMQGRIAVTNGDIQSHIDKHQKDMETLTCRAGECQTVQGDKHEELSVQQQLEDKISEAVHLQDNCRSIRRILDNLIISPDDKHPEYNKVADDITKLEEDYKRHKQNHDNIEVDVTGCYNAFNIVCKDSDLKFVT